MKNRALSFQSLENRVLLAADVSANAPTESALAADAAATQIADSAELQAETDAKDRENATDAATIEDNDEHKEALLNSGVVTEAQLAKWGDDPAKLSDLEEVYADAAELGVDDPNKIREYQERVMTNPGDAKVRENVRRDMVVDGLNLGEAAKKLNSKDILEVVEVISTFGAEDDLDVHGNGVWDKVANGGKESVYEEALIKGQGLPSSLEGKGMGYILKGMADIGRFDGDYQDSSVWKAFESYMSGDMSLKDFESAVGGGTNGTSGGSGSTPGNTAGSPGRPETPGSSTSPVTGSESPSGGGNSSNNGTGNNGADNGVGNNGAGNRGGTSPGDSSSSNPGNGGGTPDSPGPDSGTSPGSTNNNSTSGETGNGNVNTPGGTTPGNDQQGGSDADSSGPYVVDSDGFDMGGHTIVYKIFSDGTYEIVKIDNYTGKDDEVVESGYVQVDHEADTVVNDNDNESSSGSESDTDSTDDNSDSSDDTDADNEEEPDDDTEDVNGYTPGPEGGSSPEEDWNLVERFGLVDFLMIELMKKFDDLTFDSRNGSADGTPDPMGTDVVFGEIDDDFRDTVVDPGPDHYDAPPPAYTAEQVAQMWMDKKGGAIDPIEN